MRRISLKRTIRITLIKDAWSNEQSIETTEYSHKSKIN